MATAKTELEDARATTPEEAPETRRHAEDLPEILIEAERRRWRVDLKEMWARRELLYFLVWRDLKVRYRETFLSAGWALVQPTIMTVIFTVIWAPNLSKEAREALGGIPYPIYVYSGFLAWNYFASAITGASMSVVASEGLITKVYFPRLLLPLATVGTNLVDLFIASFGLVGLMFYYGITPGWSLLLLPVWVILCACAGMAVGTLWAALNVRYKDFRYLTGYLMQVWMFSTSAIFTPPSTSPDAEVFRSHTIFEALHRLLGLLNPVNTLIVSFRKVAMGGPPPWESLAITGVVIAILMVIGCSYFRRVEDSFADVI